MNHVAIAPTRRRLSVSDYHRMAEAGILGRDDRTELIDGDLFDMAPTGPDHNATVDSLTETLVVALQRRAVVRVQGSVRLDDCSQPQPDVAVLRYRADRYRTQLPGPADILLLIEVSDTTLRFDRTVKLPLYARANIPELWIVDLARRTIDAYTAPSGDAYATTRTYTQSDTAALALAPHIELNVADILGPEAAPGGAAPQ